MPSTRWSLPRAWTLLWATVALVCLAAPGTAAATSSYSDAVLDTPGLLSYWRLNETSGTTFDDSKGPNDATAAGGLTLGVTGAVSGDPDLAARFDGTNDAASASLNLSGKAKLTVEFWLKWDPFANNDKLAMEFTSNFNSNAGGFLIDPNAPQSSGTFGVGIGDSSHRNNAYFARPSAAAWHHYAFVFDTTAAGANQITPYVDGTAVSYSKSDSSTAAGSFASSTLYFMSRAGSSLFGNGDLDEVAIYDQALSADRIADHYASYGANKRPIADFSADPDDPVTGQQVTFDASASSDPDGTIERYEWDLDGNGSFETDTEDAPEAKETFGSVGDATVRLRVTDDDGGKDVESLVVPVVSPGDPPMASFSATPNPVVAGQSVAFDAAASNDPDGTLAKYEWDLDGNGSYETDTGTKATTAHSYSSKGGVAVGLRVTDDDGQPATTTRSVSVRAAGSASYPDAVIDTAGLLHYWRLGEASGTSLADIVGSSTATAAGGAALGVTGAVAADPDTATRFDGANDAASASVDLSGTSKLTLEFWLTWNAFANDDDLAMEFTSNFNSNAGGFLIDPNAPQSGGTFGVAIGDSSHRNNAYFARPSAGAWHHYAFVLDTTAAGANQITPYVDGQAVSYSKTSSSTGAGAFASSTLYFMSRAGSSLFGAGDLDEVAIYGQALDADTIAAHHESFGTNHRPDAMLDVDPSPAETGVEVELDAGDSDDSDGTIAKYEWDRDGNGSFETDTGTTDHTSHTYETAGERTIRVRVTDDDGGADVATHKLQVSPAEQAPEAAFEATLTPILAGGTVTFDAGDSDDADGMIVRYEWDLDGNGSYETDTATSATTSESYPDPGPVTVGLRVTDDDDHTDTATVPVYVQASNDAYADTVFDTSGLAHYWRLGETSGTTLEDTKGTADATTSGSPTLGAKGAIPADADTAVSFDGSNDAASATVDLSATSTITVELWLKWDAFANNDALSLELTPNFNDNAGGLLIDPNAANGQFGVGIGKTATRNNVYFTRPSAEAWHHYAFVLDATASGATQITPYVDGVAVSYSKDQSKTGTGAFANSGLYFMSRNATGLFGGGDLDELAIYTRALSGSEIEDHQAVGVNRPPVALFTAEPNPADVDEEIDFDAGDSVDLDGTIVKYEWDLDGNGSYETDTGTTNHTSETYEEAGEVTVKLRVTDNAGVADAASHELTVENDVSAPANIEEPTVTGLAGPAGTLTAHKGSWTGTQPLTYTYQWRRCDETGQDCEDISGATKGTYSLTGDDPEHTFRVVVTAHGPGGDIEAESALSEVFEPYAVSIEADSTDSLTAVIGGWTGPRPVSFTYQWQTCNEVGEDCHDIPNEAQDRSFFVSVGDTDVTVRVVTMAAANGSSVVIPSEPVVVHPDAPSSSDFPLVFGRPRHGQELEVKMRDWDRPGLTAGFQWRRCGPAGDECKDIYGAIDSRYVVTSADIGSTLRAAVTATNDGGSTIRTSLATTVVPAPAVLSTSLPTITRSGGELGEVLVANAGVWTGVSPIDYIYQWQRCDGGGRSCVDVGNATDSTYELDRADVGTRIRLRVTASNAGGRENAVSAPTALIEPDAPANSTAPTVAGSAVASGVLTAEVGDWTGVGPQTFSFEWERCDSEGSNCQQITGATAPEYVTAPEDVGATIRVTITATNEYGSDVASSAATAEISDPGPDFGPELVLAPRISGVTQVGEELTALGGAWSATGDLELTFQWQSCDPAGQSCENIDGATDPSYELDNDEVGTALAVDVTARDDTGVARARAATMQSVRTADGPANDDPPTVSGVAKEGETLSAGPGSWSAAAATSYTYKWQACDQVADECFDIDDANGTAYELTAAQVRWRLRVVVTADDGMSTTTAVSSVTDTVAATAPFNEAVPTIAGGTEAGDTLTADEGTWDGDPTIGHAYQWLRCDSAGAKCDAISGEDDSTYLLDGDDTGHTFRVRATASNTAGDTVAVSLPTAPASDADGPVLTALPAISGSVGVGRTLEVSDGEWDDPQPSSYAYQWQRCYGEVCANIAGATTAAYVPTSDDVGMVVQVAVSAVGAAGTTVVLSDTSDWIDGEPGLGGLVANLVVPSISGSPREDGTLSADPGDWTAESAISFSYQWRRCDTAGRNCSDIAYASAAEYGVVYDDLSYTLRVVVTGSAGAATHAVPSEPTPAVRPGIYGEVTNTTAPSVTGDATDGEILEATSGTWIGGELEFAWQWQRCNSVGLDCTALEDATDNTYELTADDVGFTIRVEVDAENEFESVTVESLATARVAARAPALTSDPGIDGAAVQGGELVASPGEWTGTPDIRFTYEWLRCDPEGGNCDEITNATKERYTLTAGDLDATVRVRVRAANVAGTAEALSAPVEVGPMPPPELDLEESPTLSTPWEPWEPWLMEANPGEWLSFEPISYHYQWRRCNDSGTDCHDVDGAVGQAYFTRADDVGGTVRVAVTATNAAGGNTAVSAPSEVILLAAPGDSWMPTFDEAPVFTADPTVGGALEYTIGEWSGGASYVSVSQYLERCDSDGSNCEDISTAPDSFVPSRTDSGHTLRVIVTLSDYFGHRVTAMSEPSAVIGQAPPLANISLPSVDEWQAVSYGIEYRGDDGVWAGDPELAAQWQRCDPLTADPLTEEMECVDILGATDAHQHLIAATDVGFKLRLKVTATTPDDSEIAYSEPSWETVWVDIDNQGGRFTGPAVVGETITAENSVIPDADLPVTTTYTFLRLNPGNAPTELQDGASPTYTITSADLGHQIQIEMVSGVWRLDEATTVGGGGIEIVTTPEVEGQPINDVAPTVSGDLWTGATLTAAPGEWHGGAGPLAYTYQWQRCDDEGKDCTDIPAATGADYKLARADVDVTVRVQVTASHQSASGTAASAATSSVALADVPAIGSLPTISGEPIELGTLAATTGEWDGDGPIAYSYQWQSCTEDGDDCFGIGDATGANLDLSEFEVGRTIRVVVSAANAEGMASEASEATEPVAAAPPPTVSELPIVSVLGPPEPGSTLTTDGGQWLNTDRDTLEYQWQRCGLLGAGCEDVAAPDQPSYHIASEDLGSRLRVTVTARNSAGIAAATSELGPIVTASTGSAEGKMVYLGPDRETVHLGDADRAGRTVIANCKSLGQPSHCKLWAPRISPNHKLIAIEVRDPKTAVGQGTILLMNFNGTDVRALTVGSTPSWSPDGTSIVFSTKDPVPPFGTRIATIGADDRPGSSAVWVTKTGASAQTAPDVSPDGSTLTFASNRPVAGPSIYVANADGSDLTPLELPPAIAAAYAPRFTSDGTEIVFLATAKHTVEGIPNIFQSVWAIDPDGSDLRRITPEERVTYDAVAVAPDRLTVAARRVLVHNVGGGIAVEYGPSLARRMDLDGKNPETVTEGIDPDVARPRSRPSCTGPWCVLDWICDVRDCRKSEEKWRDAAGKYPSRTLGSQMGPKPGDQKGKNYGWAAHHIVPAKDTRWTAPVVQAIAWECGLRPNQPRNGIWLRGRPRHETAPGYKDLYPRQQERQYHPVVANRFYYRNLASRLGKAYGKKDRTCNWGRFKDELHEVRIELSNGEFPMHHMEPGQ